MRTRRKINLLEITTGFTVVPGATLSLSVGPATLNDGEIYEVQIPPGIAFPPTATGNEFFQIVVAGNTPPTIVVGDRRARAVLAERVRRYRVIRMLYTNSSIIGTSTAGIPAFIAFEGVSRIP